MPIGMQSGVTFDETHTDADVDAVLFAISPQPAFARRCRSTRRRRRSRTRSNAVRHPHHPVFNTHHSETEMLRYLRRLADRDLALDRTMIPLGSCTMKLNATTEMIPVTWPEFGNLHPFAPAEQARATPSSPKS